MTIEYAVKVHPANPYFEVPEEDQYLKIHTDPAVPFRRQQAFPRGAASLVWRDGGEWQPVNGIDAHCIGMRAKHEIITKQALIDGYGWARCTCGWQDEESFKSGYASYDYEASATKHLAEVDAKVKDFRDLLRYIPRTPAQEACPHANDETMDHLHPGRKAWRCLDCDLHIQWDIHIERVR